MGDLSFAGKLAQDTELYEREKIAEEEYERKVFISRRAENIRTEVQTNVVAALVFETIAFTLFIIYAALIDENWFNWLEMAHLASWVTAVAVVATRTNILDASQTLLYVSLVVFIFDVIVIGCRASFISKGFEKVQKRDRQYAFLVHTIYLAVVSIMYMAVALRIRANFPKMVDEAGSPDVPENVTNADINRRYKEFNPAHQIAYAELGRIVNDARSRKRKERIASAGAGEIFIQEVERDYGSAYGSAYGSQYGNTRGGYQSYGQTRPNSQRALTFTVPPEHVHIAPYTR